MLVKIDCNGAISFDEEGIDFVIEMLEKVRDNVLVRRGSRALAATTQFAPPARSLCDDYGDSRARTKPTVNIPARNAATPESTAAVPTQSVWPG